jgi:hypothetical protein
MKKFRNLIAELIYIREWVWLKHLINFLCYIELFPKTLHCFAPGKVSGNIKKIPNGIYCYTNTHVCPFWDISKVAKFFYGIQTSGYCHFIGEGDFDSDTAILWDQCKCCAEKLYFDEEYEEEDDTECSLEL